MPARMFRRLVIALAVAGLGSAATGCAGARRCCSPSCASTNHVALSEIEPTVAEPDTSALKSEDAVQLASALTGRETSYRGLTPSQCQCLSVDASALGNLLASERRTVKSAGVLRHHAAHRSDVERRMLYYASQEARNKSAGDALRVYWGLAEAENSRPILRDSRAESDHAVRDLEELLKRGLIVPVDATLIRSQSLSLEDRQLELDLTVERLNEQLKPMVDLDTSDPSWHIWPETELKLVVEPIDIDSAVAEGLQLRPELRLLRMLTSNLDKDTLPAARRALGSINGALGSSESGCCACLAALTKWVACCDSCELATRCRQLQEYRADREAAVAAEIRQGAHAVVTAAARVAVAEQQVQLRSTNVKNLESKLPSGGANAFELHRARLELLDSRREVISQLIVWETARVELRQAQGKLVDECRSGACR